MARVELSAPPSNMVSHVRVGEEEATFPIPYQLLIWLNSIFNRVGAGPFKIQGYSLSGLPDAERHGTIAGDKFSSLIFITDEVGGPTMAFSDGTNWLRMSDNAIVSAI